MLVFTVEHQSAVLKPRFNPETGSKITVANRFSILDEQPNKEEKSYSRPPAIFLREEPNNVKNLFDNLHAKVAEENQFTLKEEGLMYRINPEEPKIYSKILKYLDENN